MLTESNIFQWIGSTIDKSLETVIDVTAERIISTFTEFFIYGGTLTFTFIGFAIIFGYIEAPASHFIKTCGKFLIISGLVLSSDTYLAWVAEFLHGIEISVVDAFAASTNKNPATSIYQVLDKSVTDGLKVGKVLYLHALNQHWYHIGQILLDIILAIVMYLATLTISIPAGAMIIVSKIMLTIMIAVGPFFIAMLMFPMTAKWFDTWTGQFMTYVLQIALVTMILSMGTKFFNHLAKELITDNADYRVFTILESLIVTRVTLFLLQRGFEAGAALAGGISSACITLRQLIQTSPIKFNPKPTRRDMQSGMMVTNSHVGHLVSGNTILNPAYRQYMRENLLKNWKRASGGKVEK